MVFQLPEGFRDCLLKLFLWTFETIKTMFSWPLKFLVFLINYAYSLVIKLIKLVLIKLNWIPPSSISQPEKRPPSIPTDPDTKKLMGIHSIQLPILNELVENKVHRERIRGSIVGLAVGDALGAPVEFRPYQYLVDNPVRDFVGGGTWGLSQGQFTDDTSMALCLAYSLISHGRFSLYDQLVRYKWWYRDGFMSSTGECFDIGASTRAAIQEFEKRQRRYAESIGTDIKNLDENTGNSKDPNIECKCGARDAAGNGGLMRLAPIPLFFYRQPRWAVFYSGESCLTTHGDIRVYDACRFYGALIVGAMSGLSKEEILDRDFYVKHSDWFGNKPLVEEIQTIMRGSYRNKSPGSGGIRGAGYVAASLEAALWAFYNDKNSFEVGVLSAVNLGDDTDTTAAIYGQLAGAFYGYDAIPVKWSKNVSYTKFLTHISDHIDAAGAQWNRPH